MSKIKDMIPIQVYVDKVTHRRLKLRAFQEGKTMSEMICGFLVRETFNYDEAGLPTGAIDGEEDTLSDAELAEKEKELAEYAAQQEKAKRIVAAYLNPKPNKA